MAHRAPSMGAATHSAAQAPTAGAQGGAPFDAGSHHHRSRHHHHASVPAQAVVADASSTGQDTMSVLLATAGYDHTIRFWEAWSGLCSRTVAYGDSAVNTLAISPNKHWLAAGGYNKIRVYDCTSSVPVAAGAGGAASSGGGGGGGSGMGSSAGRPAGDAPVLDFAAHNGNVTALLWQMDARWLASGSDDGTVKIWDIRMPTHKPTRSYSHGSQNGVNDLAVNPNQGEIVACDQAGSVKIWDLAQDNCTHDLWPSYEPSLPIRSVSVALDGTYLCAGDERGRVYVWTLAHLDPLLSPAGEGLDLDEMPLEDEFQLQAATQFRAHSETEFLTKCRISPDSQWLATTSSDKTIKIWKKGDDFRFSLNKVLEGHQRWVWDAAFSADSAYLVSASSDNTARLWELASGTTVRQYTAHRALIAVTLNDHR